MKGGELSVPGNWRRGRSRYDLIGHTCPVCHQVYANDRPVCPHCPRRNQATTNFQDEQMNASVMDQPDFANSYPFALRGRQIIDQLAADD